MAESTNVDQRAVRAEFAEHIRAFHRGLPPEEQALLEAVFSLAQSAARDDGDVQGFSTQPFGLLALVEQMQAPFPTGLAGDKLKPKG